MPVCVARPSVLMHRIEANLHGHITCVHRHAGMVVRDEPLLLLADSGLASDTFNKIARARLAPERCMEEIGRAVGYFRSVGRPFAWWVGPASRPLDLEQRLRGLGFECMERESGMLLGLHDLREAPLPAGLTVERVQSPAQLRDLSRVLAASFEPPDPAVAPFYQAAAPLILDRSSPMRCFLGYVDGEPAGTSGLYLEGGAGGIYSVATQRAFRGRGIGSRLAWAAADEARRAGASLAVLQASPQGKAIYERLGFRDFCSFAEYTLRPAPDRRPRQ